MTASVATNRGVRAFALATAGSWVVFHGAPLLGLELLPMGDVFPSADYTVVAFLALAAVLGGLAVGAARTPRGPSEPDHALSVALEPTAKFLKVAVLPLSVAAALTAIRVARGGYRDVSTLPRPLNLALYVCLTLLPVVLWNRRRLERRTYAVLLAMIVVPRLLISLTGPRFFVLQAVIPIAFWEWVHARHVSMRKVAAGTVGSYLFLFHLVPALRNDSVSGLQHIVLGSPITLVPQLKAMRILEDAPATLVPCEIVAGVTTHDICGLREFFAVPNDVDPRLDKAATHFTREQTGMDAVGTGGNPLLEAFPELDAGWGLVWFAAVGFVCGSVVRGMCVAPVCCFLLPHVAAKGLFFWRGTLSEFFDRIPLLLVAYGAIAAAAALQRRQACAS